MSQESGRLLLVEDEAVIRWHLSEELTDRGFAVEAAATCAQALAVFRAEHETFRGIICDVGLPDGAGHAFAHNARQVRSDIPVVFCSGFDARELDNHAIMAAGRVRLVNKPCLVEDLITSLREAEAEPIAA